MHCQYWARNNRLQISGSSEDRPGKRRGGASAGLSGFPLGRAVRPGIPARVPRAPVPTTVSKSSPLCVSFTLPTPSCDIFANRKVKSQASFAAGDSRSPFIWDAQPTDEANPGGSSLGRGAVSPTQHPRAWPLCSGRQWRLLWLDARLSQGHWCARGTAGGRVQGRPAGLQPGARSRISPHSAPLLQSPVCLAAPGGTPLAGLSQGKPGAQSGDSA